MTKWGIALLTLPIAAWAAVPNHPSVVTVQGTQLLVRKRLPDGTLSTPTPYTIKGMDWQPATRAPATGPIPPGYPSPSAGSNQYGFFYDWAGRNPQGHVVFNYWLSTEFQAHYQQDIPLMAQMHINTVRLFGDFGDDPAAYGPILDTLYNAHIMVIMSVASSAQDITSGRYLRVMQYCQNHPAILMFTIGNEWNLNNLYGTYPDLASTEAAVNSVIPLMKAQDPNHPVSSCLGDPGSSATMVSLVNAVPGVDIWSLNIYRGKSFGTIFTDWDATGKPFFFSEFGIDSFNTTTYSIVAGVEAQATAGSEDQAAQTSWDLALWNEIQTNLSSQDAGRFCAGGVLFSWNDQIYEVGDYNLGMGDIPPSPGGGYASYDVGGFYIPGASPDDVTNEEYFGIVDADRNPKQAYTAMQAYYPTVAPLPVKSVQIASPGASFINNHAASITVQALDAFEEAVPDAIISRFEWTITPQQGAPGSETVTTPQGVLNLATLNLQPGAFRIAVQAFGTNGATSNIVQVLITMAAADFSALRVYPSPWRSDLHTGHPITFDGLTVDATVKIFTVSGHWVRTLGPGNGAVTWDLKNDSGDLVASGLYFYLITNDQGQKTRGKLAIIR
jgi:hypothetical protein